MKGKIDWMWIAMGALIIVALNFAAGVLLELAIGPPLKITRSEEEINIIGGQILLALMTNAASFLIGGFIVGIKSTGRSILEPGMSALIAVLIALLLSRQITILNLIGGGVIPFFVGLLGGWLGERRQKAA